MCLSLRLHCSSPTSLSLSLSREIGGVGEAVCVCEVASRRHWRRLALTNNCELLGYSVRNDLSDDNYATHLPFATCHLPIAQMPFEFPHCLLPLPLPLPLPLTAFSSPLPSPATFPSCQMSDDKYAASVRELNAIYRYIAIVCQSRDIALPYPTMPYHRHHRCKLSP